MKKVHIYYKKKEHWIFIFFFKYVHNFSVKIKSFEFGCLVKRHISTAVSWSSAIHHYRHPMIVEWISLPSKKEIISAVKSTFLKKDLHPRQVAESDLSWKEEEWSLILKLNLLIFTSFCSYFVFFRQILLWFWVFKKYIEES